MCRERRMALDLGRSKGNFTFSAYCYPHLFSFQGGRKKPSIFCKDKIFRSVLNALGPFWPFFKIISTYFQVFSLKKEKKNPSSFKGFFFKQPTDFKESQLSSSSLQEQVKSQDFKADQISAPCMDTTINSFQFHLA